MISDECHRSIYGKWRGVLEHFDGVQIGLTATPCVADLDDEAPDEEDKLFVRDTMRFFEVDAPTYSYKMRDAIREGYLVPYQIYKAKTVKTAAEGGFPVSRAELDWNALDAESRTEFEKLFEAGDPITVDPSTLERRFTIPAAQSCDGARISERPDPWICGWQRDSAQAAVGKDHRVRGDEASRRRRSRSCSTTLSRSSNLPPRFAMRITWCRALGMRTVPTLRRVIKRFKKEKFPEILVSVNMLDTGFDCPEVVNLVFARFTKSAILYQQMRGRGTRKSKGKPLFTMFDFVGVIGLSRR